MVQFTESGGNRRTLLNDVEFFWKTRYFKAKTSRGKPIGRSKLADRISITRNHLLPMFGQVKFKDLSTESIDNWVLEAFASGNLSGQMINHDLFNLRILLDFALADGLMLSNPARSLKPAVVHAKEGGALTSTEVAALISPAFWNGGKILYRTAIVLSLLTGMRAGEVRGLRWENVHPT